ncbi:MAG: hypothetical protein LBI59_11360 [Candidatus Accumulibacter sp.]|jgi:hypothetical protein|nr:hypothetical protein [Accumulibacter sp.]
MLRFFLFMACVMAASTSTAGEASPCSVDTVPTQIMTPGRGGSEIKRSASEISNDLSHFRAFVTVVMEHVAARLSMNKLCMDSAESKERSLLQFVRWPLVARHNFLVPALPIDAYAEYLSGCRISSPWIDLAIARRPVPWIRGIVYWNERQLLVDQAALAGARNVPLSVAMPLMHHEFDHFASEYENTELSYPRKPAAKPIEERVPPDILWLLRRSPRNERAGHFERDISRAMNKATEKGAESYTKLVIALIDRCFASNGAPIHYNSILDVADPVLFEQYKIDMPLSR